MSSTYTPSANRQKNTSTISDQIVIHPGALNSFSPGLVHVVPVLNSANKDSTELNSNNRPRM